MCRDEIEISRYWDPKQFREHPPWKSHIRPYSAHLLNIYLKYILDLFGIYYRHVKYIRRTDFLLEEYILGICIK